jgi:hypothetical protein
MSQAGRVLEWLVEAARRCSRRISVARMESLRFRHRQDTARAQAADYDALGWS